MNDQQIGHSIQEARYRRGLMQQELADAIGLDRTAISRIEQGKRAVTALELLAIAEVLDTEIGEFLQAKPSKRLPASASLLLRAERVDIDDFPQLNWFINLYQDLLIAEPSMDHPFQVEARVFRMPPRQGGELAARRVRAFLGIPDAPIKGLSGVALHLGLAVTLARLPSRSKVSGCLIREPESPGAVLINANHPPARQRYTLAHEIGHFMLDGDARSHTCTVSGMPRAGRRSIAEFRADVFASALLLPRRAVEKSVQSGEATVLTLRQLERTFGISHAATVSRLRGLGVIPLAEARLLQRMGFPARRSQLAAPFRRIGQWLACRAPSALGENCEVVGDDEVVR